MRRITLWINPPCAETPAQSSLPKESAKALRGQFFADVGHGGRGDLVGGLFGDAETPPESL